MDIASALEWPGASSAPALLDGRTLRGRWVDRDGLRAARRSEPTAETAFTSHPTVRLTPLPCWADLDPEQLRRKHHEVLAEVLAESRGAKVLGIRKILAQHPHACPIESSRSAAPACHTSSPRIRERFRRLYRAFVMAFRRAAEAARLLMNRPGWADCWPG